MSRGSWTLLTAALSAALLLGCPAGDDDDSAGDDDAGDDDAGDDDAGDDDAGDTCADPGDHDEVVEVDGVEHPFRVHVPPGLVEGAPVVLQLHGLGGSGENQDLVSGFSTLADERTDPISTTAEAWRFFQAHP